jgi:hypothetical protein
LLTLLLRRAHVGSQYNRPVYHLSNPSDRAEFDRKVEDGGAKCYQATVEFVDRPRVLTEEILRDHLAQFMEHVEVDIECEYWKEEAVEL